MCSSHLAVCCVVGVLFHSDRWFVDWAEDSGFHYLNVLKANVHGANQAINYLHCSPAPLFVPLPGNKQWLSDDRSTNSMKATMTVNNNTYKTNAPKQNSSAALTESDGDYWLPLKNFSIVKYNHSLFSVHSAHWRNSTGSSFRWNFAWQF